MSEKLRIVEVEDRTELYCHYSGQINPQPAYIEIDPEMHTLSMGYNPEIGNAILADVFHGRLLRTSLPMGAIPTAAGANAMMRDLLDEATALADSYTERWDGNNYIGQWDEELRLAWDLRIDEYDISYTDQVQVWAAADWLQNEPKSETAARYGITADTTDEELRAISDRMDEEEKCDEMDVLKYSESYCEAIRDYLREQRDED